MKDDLECLVLTAPPSECRVCRLEPPCLAPATISDNRGSCVFTGTCVWPSPQPHMSALSSQSGLLSLLREDQNLTLISPQTPLVLHHALSLAASRDHAQGWTEPESSAS